MAEGLELETDHGVIVSDVEPDGPAAHAGVQVDDIVVALNGQPVSTVHQLEARVYRLGRDKGDAACTARPDQLDLPVMAEEQSGGELDALADLVDPVKNVVPELGIVGLDINKQVLALMPELRRPAGVVVAARQADAPYSGPPLAIGRCYLRCEPAGGGAEWPIAQMIRVPSREIRGADDRTGRTPDLLPAEFD